MRAKWSRILTAGIEMLILGLALSIFVTIAFYRITLPGPHTDEALEVIPAVQLVQGQEVECFKDVCLDLFGLRLPVMIYEYIATVNTYMAIPFFAILGINVTALRTMPIVQSAVAMVFLYLLARELYNRRVATIAVFMLAVCPSFVFWSRQGVFVTSVTIPISMAAAWVWLRWWRRARQNRRGQAIYFYVGCFLFGLGISAKFLFGWLIAGIGSAFVLLNLDNIVACLRERSLAPLHVRLRWRDLLIGGLLLAVGLLPQIIFNIRTQSTINYIRDNVFAASYYDVDNTNIAENLRVRIKELRSVLNGETFWYLSIHPYASWRYPSVFLIALGVAAFSLFGSKRHTLRETLPAWSTVTVVVVVGYLALFFSNLKTPFWYVLVIAAGVAAAAITGLGRAAIAGSSAARLRGWKAWLGWLGTGLSASLLFIFFAYLAWKFGKWKATDKTYLLAVLTLILSPLLRAREAVRKILFPLLVIVVTIALSVFTPTALWFTHLAIIVPWPVLAIAATADMAARQLGLDGLNLGRWPILAGKAWAAAASLGLAAVLALAGMLIYDDLEVDVAYYRELVIVGGKGEHTVASYRLVEYLQEQQIDDVVAMDMAIQDVVQFLSAGEINPVEIFGYQDRNDVDGAFAIRVREQLDNPDAVYIFHVNYVQFRNRWETFQTIVAQEGKEWVEMQLVYDWSAMPVFRVVKVVP
ncbi:MAG: glycosyltransferase family 39 protein [Anaerolineae bacterium]|nr:glycosyltransferase family 39 protein [Anaerolineae bacterium]